MAKQLKHSILQDLEQQEAAISQAAAESLDEYNERQEEAQQITDEERNYILTVAEQKRKEEEAAKQAVLDNTLNWGTASNIGDYSVKAHQAAITEMVQEAHKQRVSLSGEALANYETVNSDLFKEDKPEPQVKQDYDLVSLSIDVSNAKEQCKKQLLEFASQYGLFGKTTIALDDLELLQRYENIIKYLLDSEKKGKLNIKG